MTLGTNIRQLGGHWRKDFKGQRSEVMQGYSEVKYSFPPEIFGD